MSTKKLCVFCKHFDLFTGAGDTFSEIAGNMYCRKEHWDSGISYPSADEDSLRSVIFTAETCKDYSPVKEAE